jgi:hypothetical protein
LHNLARRTHRFMTRIWCRMPGWSRWRRWRSGPGSA